MSYEILIPQLSFSMTEGTIAEWLKAEGNTVTERAPLFVIEADKSTVEVPAPASGAMKIGSEIGVTYETGTVIGTLG